MKDSYLGVRQLFCTSSTSRKSKIKSSQISNTSFHDADSGPATAEASVALAHFGTYLVSQTWKLLFGNTFIITFEMPGFVGARSSIIRWALSYNKEGSLLI